VVSAASADAEPTRRTNAFGTAHGPQLGVEWLTWWTSLVDRRPQPSPADDDAEPAFDTPDPLGLTPLPALRGIGRTAWG
jgi:hypothetical protein